MANGNSQFLYHWTTSAKGLAALKNNRLQARRWAHYLENENLMVKGSSWSLDQWQWSRDNPICLVVDRAKLSNTIHSINGNRTYWQTKGMVDPLYDPDAYKEIPTDPDEEFIEGTVKPLSAVLTGVLVRNLPEITLTQVREYTDGYGVQLTLLNH